MTSHQTRWLPTAIMAFLGVCWLGVLLATDGGTLWQAPAELIFVVPLVVVLRSMRSGVYANRERLRIRSLWHTRTVLLTEISDFTSTPRRGDSQDPLRSDVLQVVLTSGEVIRTPIPLRNLLEGRKLSGAVYERDEYLRIKNHLEALVRNSKLEP